MLRTSVLCASLLCVGACAAPTRITFLHLNDVYEAAPKDGRGGLAQFMTLLERARRRSAHHVTTFGGDLLSPSLLSTLTKGAHMIELVNALGVEVAVLGNHELDFGLPVLRERIAQSRFAWLATNVREVGGALLRGTYELALRDVGGVRFGFFGVLTPETAQMTPASSRLEFRQVKESATRAVAQLRARGAEVVVALTHLGLAEDRALARDVRGIDLVLGGHDHEPISLQENGVLIFKSGSEAQYLGVVELEVTRPIGEDGKPHVRVTPVTWRHVANAGTPAHEALLPIVQRLQGTLDTALGAALGQTRVALDSRGTTVRSTEAAIGNFIADAMRASVGADVALVNGGSIRGNRRYDAGATLTRKDIVSELPFSNVVMVIELTGAALRTTLEHAVGQVDGRSGRFLQVSGLKFAYSPAAPLGQRIVELSVGGAPLEPQKRYRVAATDFLITGGDGHQAIKEGRVLVTAEGGTLLVSAVIDYLQRQKQPIAPAVEGRIERR